MSFNFTRPSGSSSHNCMRMNGSLPLTVNLSHLLGFDRISLTLPCDNPITKSPNTLCGMLPRASFSRTCLAMSKVSRNLCSSYCCGVSEGRDLRISRRASMEGDKEVANGVILPVVGDMLEYASSSVTTTSLLRSSGCCTDTIISVGVLDTTVIVVTGSGVITIVCGGLGDTEWTVAPLSTMFLCSISTLAKARMLFTASSVEALKGGDVLFVVVGGLRSLPGGGMLSTI